MKKVFITIISILLPMIVSAALRQVRGTDVNGIYYLFDSSQKTATVTCKCITYSGTTFIEDYDKADYSGAIEIPSEVTYDKETYKVTAIGDVAFADCMSVTSVSIPEGVVSIGQWSFSGTAWYNSQSDGLLYLDNWLIGYKGDQPTGELNIAEGTKGIAAKVLSGCTDLTFVTIPSSMKFIGDNAFSGCGGLTSIDIPNSVLSIGASAFWGCSSLPSIIIPNSVTSIGAYAFLNCSGLKSVELHIKTIGNWFSGLSSIETITIGSEVESIEDNAFFGCSNIRVNISDLSKWCKISLNRPLLYRTYEVYMGMGEGYDQRTAVEPYQLYLNGEELTNLVIPDDVESIGSYIFSYCSSLTSVTIGSGVTNIGNYAFDGCQNLTDVYLQSENAPEIGSNAFPYK